MTKLISVVIPTYNEEQNVTLLAQRLINIFETQLQKYDYEIIFIDNDSSDNTRQNLQILCNDNRHIKAIFNAKNFGPLNSQYYGICQANGDAVITMCADLQEPPEMIVKFVQEWENGEQVVCAIKSSSKEKKIVYFLRSCYYKLIKKISTIDQIEHFTGFGLYDCSFVNILRQLDDPVPFLRGIVAEFAVNPKKIYYEQQKRQYGKSSYNWYLYYDTAMLSFTSYTKIGLRMATFLGFACSIISVVIALIYFVMKLMYWDRFSAGMAPIVIGVFLIGGIQLFFIGLIGEYILNMTTRLMNRPLVVEKKRINFDESDDK